MMHPVESLQKALDDTIRLVDQGPFLSFTLAEKASLRGEATDLADKLTSIEGGFLTVGLLGGTGVGKSTLMNAIAGSEIASTSHRRPHTDEILIYRHVEAAPLPTRLLMDVPWREITHPEKAIHQILLCDLPDFDSLAGEHRDSVLGFMEHLDVLIWVTSPEKYADGRFYELLQQVPKSEQNFYFVLNKVDLLFDGQTRETGYEQMASMAGRFREHIKKTGIDAPILYTLSSEEALAAGELSPWNHFPAFRQQIFQQRNMKQIRAIKAANLDVQVQRLLARFEMEVRNLKSFERILQDAAEVLKKELAQWIQTGHDAIGLWLEGPIRQELLLRLTWPSCLVGPGRSLSALLDGWGGRFVDQRDGRSDSAPFIPPEETVATFRRRFVWLEDRLHHHISRDNLPPAFQAWVREELDVGKGIEDLKERFSQIVAARLGARLSPSYWRFQWIQVLTYFLLLACFLFAIGSETAWQGVLENPGARTILPLVLSGIHTLFSVKGLAALGSYVILNLLFALRFYRRYRRLRDKAVEKITAAMGVEIGRLWEEALAATFDQLDQLRKETQARISAISNLREK